MVDSMTTKLMGRISNYVVGIGTQLGSLLLLLTGIADSTPKTSMVYFLALLSLRFSSLQTIHGRCIVPIDVSLPKQQDNSIGA